MKRSMRFLVAKYTPDLTRMEPRNVGLILWADSGATVARFLGERDGQLYMPPLIERGDRHAFREWISYWRHHLGAGKITLKSGEVVNSESPRFVDALQEKSKPQFRLVDGGTFTDRISEGQLDDVLAEMFERVVERPSTEQARAELMDLTDAFRGILSRTGVEKRPDFQPNLPVPRHVHGVLRQFVVDAALGPVGRPRVVMQKVLLLRRQSIDSNAFMFDALRGDSQRPMAKENCVAFVNENQPLDSEAKSGLKMLKNIATVVDVSQAWAVKAIEDLAGSTDTSPN